MNKLPQISFESSRKHLFCFGLCNVYRYQRFQTVRRNKAKTSYGDTLVKNKRVFSYNLCIKIFGAHTMEISFTITILFTPVMHPLRWLKSMFLKKFNAIPFFSLTWSTATQDFGYKTEMLRHFPLWKTFLFTQKNKK